MRFPVIFFHCTLVMIAESALRLSIPPSVKLSKALGWARIPQPPIKFPSLGDPKSLLRRKRELTLKSPNMLTDYFVRLLIPEMVGVQVPFYYCLTNKNGSFCHFCEYQRSGIVCGWGEAQDTRPRAWNFDV